MIRVFLIVILVFTKVSPGISQKDISGRILDVNGQFIPYVNIGVPERATGTVSDQEGNFTLDFLKQGDTVLISAIGYEDKLIPFEWLVEMAAQESVIDIVLKDKEYTLESIVIKGKKIKSETVRIGSKNKNRGHSIGFGSIQLGSEIGAPLHFEHPVLVSNAGFVINHIKGDSMLFRIKLYRFSARSVGEQILRENVMVREAQNKVAFTVDLFHLNLTLEGHYLLSLEWVQDIDGNGNEGLTFDTKSAGREGGTYLKLSSNGAFTRVPYIKDKRPCFYIIGTEYRSN